jgi:hypothetical protein
LVRHHDKLRAGMEFVGLSAEQQASIRAWTGETQAEATTDAAREKFVERLPAKAVDNGDANRSRSA